jgi:hypothetical protein
VLTGNLTRDPVLRTTSSGTPVCGLRIASNTRRKTSGGECDDGDPLFLSSRRPSSRCSSPTSARASTPTTGNASSRVSG